MERRHNDRSPVADTELARADDDLLEDGPGGFGPPPPLRWPEDDGVEYTPAPPPLAELPPALRADYYDDPGFVLQPWATAGCSAPPPALGVLGRCTRAGEKIATQLGAPMAHGFFGVPRSGKTYAMGALTELWVQRTRYLSVLPEPGCAVALYLRAAPKLLAAVWPNQDPAQVERLVYEYGSLPQGLADVVWLTVPEDVLELRGKYPHGQVHGLRLSCSELGLDNLRSLLGIEPDATTLMARQVSQLLAALPRGFTFADLWYAAAAFPFHSRRVRRLVRDRLRGARRWIDDRRTLLSLPRAGRLIVIDLGRDWLGEEEAARLCAIVLDVLALRERWLPGAGMGTARGFPLLLVLDEVHHFLRWPRLVRQIERLVRERRHFGAAVALGSQDPMALPVSLLGQLDGIGVFQHGSARWTRHLAQECPAFAVLGQGDTAGLPGGRMFYWAQRWWGGGGELGGNLVLIDGRPRLSHHDEEEI